MKANELNGKTIIGVPRQWVRPETPDFTTFAYDELIDAEHYSDGWKDIVSPTFNSQTQRLITNEVNKILDNGTIIGYEYKLYTYTTSEISTNEQNATDNDDSATKVLNRRDDGEIYYKRIMDRIERALRDSQLGVAAIKYSNRYFDVALSPLTRGNWASAQTALSTAPVLTPYTAQEKTRITSLYNEVKEAVNTYVTQTYS